LRNSGEIVFQVGANTSTTNQLSIATLSIASTATGIGTAASALLAIDSIDDKLASVTTARANYGAMQSRFESAISNLQVGLENQAAARGRIMDADFAVETANMTRAQILQQAGNAMISQANASPQSVLQLLG